MVEPEVNLAQFQRSFQVDDSMPIFPNRAGRFTVVISLTDAIHQKTATFRYPLNVLDVGAIAGK